MKTRKGFVDTAVLAIGGIALASILAIFLIGAALVAGANNSAVRSEQTVEEQQSAISVQLQRRNDLIKSLVSTVTAAGNLEKSTLKEVIEMRSASDSGNVEQAALAINAVVEAYPEIKSVAAYQQLMLELSTTENLISEQRKTYNASVRSYLSFVRSFPNGMLLGMAGYEVRDFSYLELDTPTYNPELFKNQ